MTVTTTQYDYYQVLHLSIELGAVKASALDAEFFVNEADECSNSSLLFLENWILG